MTPKEIFLLQHQENLRKYLADCVGQESVTSLISYIEKFAEGYEKIIREEIKQEQAKGDNFEDLFRLAREDDNSLINRVIKNTTKKDYREWSDKIPYIKFPDNLKVKVIPPFMGAVIRFLVSDLEEKVRVSVYLDCYDAIGCYGKPYWEICPINRDIFRYDIADTKNLIKGILRSIEEQSRKIIENTTEKKEQEERENNIS